MSVLAGEETDVIEGVEISLSVRCGIVILGASDQSVTGIGEEEPRGGNELDLPGDEADCGRSAPGGDIGAGELWLEASGSDKVR